MHKIETSKKEIIDILKAWIVISISFAVILGDKNILSTNFLYNLLMAALTVGVGFLFHELSHKFLAQKYGAMAEFRSYDIMLVLALVMSFFGAVFAAPANPAVLYLAMAPLATSIIAWFNSLLNV